MRSYIKIACLFILLGVSVSGSASNLKATLGAENKQTVELVLNGDKYQIPNANPDARVEIYSIIGSKVSSFDMRGGYYDSSTTLPKGYYIVKIENTTKKIAIR